MTTLDTHAVVKDLQTAGFDEKQAEAVARAVVRGADFSHLATKSDLAAGLRETELRLEVKIEAVKSEIQRWMIAQMVVIIGVMAALLRFMG